LFFWPYVVHLLLGISEYLAHASWEDAGPPGCTVKYLRGPVVMRTETPRYFGEESLLVRF